MKVEKKGVEFPLGISIEKFHALLDRFFISRFFYLRLTKN